MASDEAHANTPAAEPAQTQEAPPLAESTPEATADTADTADTAADAPGADAPAAAVATTPAIEADPEEDRDSAFADDDGYSETTSIASSMIRGHIENGRKYSTLRDDYWGPSDEQQFEVMDVGHLLFLLLESKVAEQTGNMLFRSPIKWPKEVLDIGTGSGTWAIDVADKFPDANVHGVDLFPPPHTWVPPNCILEVEDVSQEWTWKIKYDLIHMRLMFGAFSNDDWATLYGKCYENIKPGGWIEQVELEASAHSDDGSLPADSLLAGWGPNFIEVAERAGRPLDTYMKMKKRIEDAGFVNVQEDLFKVPIGPWPKDKLMKEIGRQSLQHWAAGLDGAAMWLLTKYGSPEPWTADEVRVYVAKVRNELHNKSLHIWHYVRRVWGQKPMA